MTSICNILSNYLDKNRTQIIKKEMCVMLIPMEMTQKRSEIHQLQCHLSKTNTIRHLQIFEQEVLIVFL